jgi:hypothetical protein
MLPRIRAFRKLDRHSYPSSFSEYEPNTYGKDGKYEKMVADGDIDYEVGTGLKAGPAKWEEVLREIEFAFDWKVNCDFGNDKQQEEFYKRWCYKNPTARIESNKGVSYIYHMTDKYREEEEGRIPFVKDFGGLAKEVSSDEPDLHIKNPENYKFIKERVFYYDVKYAMEISKRAMNGAKLWGIHFFSCWD